MSRLLRRLAGELEAVRKGIPTVKLWSDKSSAVLYWYSRLTWVYNGRTAVACDVQLVYGCGSQDRISITGRIAICLGGVDHSLDTK